MADAKYHVSAIGNAIVDVLVHCDDEFLRRSGYVKGVMSLITHEEVLPLYASLPPSKECSGGSAANTIVGVAQLGLKTAFLGKVHQDPLGDLFRTDIQNANVHFPTPSATTGPQTAQSFILVTPDAQRTMITYLGACIDFGPDDVDRDVIAQSKITYLEGYLFDPPHAKEAFRLAAKTAHDAHRKVALSLSDPFCVSRHREEFLDLVSGHVDILFSNEVELMALYETKDFDQAVRNVRGHTDVAAITRGAEGSVVITADDIIAVPADKIEKVDDTTGAGDLYAAGFLAGLGMGRDYATCARMGGITAGEVISHLGARPEQNLIELIKAKL